MQTSRYYALKEGNLDPPSLSNMYPPSSSGTHYPSTVTLGTDEDLKSPDTEYDSRWSDILHGGSSIRKFSRLISALDLSTTPYGIQQAQIRCTRTKIHDTPPTPLVHLMESYRLPYPGSLTFLKSFEARTLLRFIRPDSQSQSILIRYDGSLIRRRVLPIIPKPPPPIARIMNKIYGEFNAFRSFEGLDLAGGQREKAYMDNESWKNVQFTFHRPPRWKAIFSQIPLFFIAAISGFALLYAGFHLFFFPFGSVERRLCIVVQSKYPCEISPNPDVAGVGGRAALYLQTFIASVLLTFSRKGAIPASWALLVTSTAFTLTALVSTATHQLTLYHVTIVAKMQGLPLVVLTIVEVFPPRIRGPYMFLLIRIRLLVSTAVLLWYTLMAPCFGSQPECNAHVLTRGWFVFEAAIGYRTRSFSLLIAYLVLLFNIFQAMFFPLNFTLGVQALFSEDARRKWHNLPQGYTWARPRSWINIIAFSLIASFFDNSTPQFIKAHNSPQDHGRYLDNYSLPRPATASSYPISQPSPTRLMFILRVSWLNVKNALRYPKVWRSMVACIVAAVLVRNIEYTIRANDVGIGENTWTYGQVLCVMLTVVSIVQLLQFFGLVPTGSRPMKAGKRKDA